MWKIKFHKFISENPIYIILGILCILITIPTSLLIYFIYLKPLLLTFTFVGSTTMILMMITSQFILREWLIELDFALTYKLYKYFKIEEKLSKIKLNKIKDKLRKDILSTEMKKRQTKEISPMRRYLIKNLEDE